MRSVAMLCIGLLSVLGGCARRTVEGPPSRPVVVTADARGPNRLDIPPGQLPAPGQCRIWFPGRPPGQQPRPRPCAGIRVPLGAWLLSRPEDRSQVRVAFYDDKRVDIVIAVRIYMASSGEFVREER